jgi:carboxyl-terminal processing protease
MKFITISILLLFKFTMADLFSSEFGRIEQNLLKLIVNWGYLENYHPLVISNKINADSVFCQFSNNIIEKNSTFSLDQLLNVLNTKLSIPATTNISMYKRLYEDRMNPSKSYLRIFPDSLISNERVIFNTTTNQLVFHKSEGLSQPFPSACYRILGLAKIWNNYKFYYPYPKILRNANAYENLLIKYIKIILECKNYLEYHLAILRFTAEYKDSHSHASSFIINNHFGKKTIPAKVKYIRGKVIITEFYDESLGIKSSLKIGDYIIKVNGKSIGKIFKTIKPFISSSNSAALNRDLAEYSLKTNQDSIRIQIKRNGICLSMDVPTYTLEDLLVREQNRLKNNSLIKFNDSTLFVSCKYVDTSKFRNMLIENHKLKWFIFDLRSSTNWIKPVIEDFFFQKESIFATYYTPLPARPGYFSNLVPLSIGPSLPIFQIKNPRVFILVDENTQSRGEFQTMFLQAIPRAVTIGSQTAGADGNITEFAIPGNISIMMTSLGIQYPDGKITQSKGIKIDYTSYQSLKDARHGIDQELRLALKIIKRGD